MLLKTVKTHLTNHSRISLGIISLVRKMSSSEYSFETLSVTKPADHVLHVELNRPNKRNAMNQQFFKDMRDCFSQISEDTHARAVVLSGSGKHFTSGLDVMAFAQALMPQPGEDVGRKAFLLRKMIKELQDSMTVIEKCPQPVIAAIHSACIGGGVDMICACDIRVCTNDTWFEIKEVDLALAADLGTLQRLPKIIGNDSLARELAFTARPLRSDEAEKVGLVSRVFGDKESMMESAFNLAKKIATKSPVALQATKLQMNYARGRTIEEGLDYIASWNMGLLQTQDLLTAAQATLQKEEAKFDDMKSKL